MNIILVLVSLFCISTATDYSDSSDSSSSSSSSSSSTDATVISNWHPVTDTTVISNPNIVLVNQTDAHEEEDNTLSILTYDVEGVDYVFCIECRKSFLAEFRSLGCPSCKSNEKFVDDAEEEIRSIKAEVLRLHHCFKEKKDKLDELLGGYYDTTYDAIVNEEEKEVFKNIKVIGNAIETQLNKVIRISYLTALSFDHSGSSARDKGDDELMKVEFEKRRRCLYRRFMITVLYKGLIETNEFRNGDVEEAFSSILQDELKIKELWEKVLPMPWDKPHELKKELRLKREKLFGKLPDFLDEAFTVLYDGI